MSAGPTGRNAGRGDPARQAHPGRLPARPLAVLLPVPGGPMLLLDAGRHVDVRPDHLVQFAHMGSLFMEAVYGVERPRVGLLSIGEEPRRAPRGRGGPRAAGGVASSIHRGTSRATTSGPSADVVVTDGFTGNVALKADGGHVAPGPRAIRDAVDRCRWPRSAGS